MSEQKLIDNKQMVHIISEVVVMLGMTFYFSSKNKQLQGYIDELSQRLEEQEDRVHKLEGTLQQLNTNFGQFVQENRMTVSNLVQKMNVPSPSQSQPKKVKQKMFNLKSQPLQPPPQPKKVVFVEQEKEDEEEISDSELDEEIQEELKDLKEDNVLKKQD
jgi:hypothetical protein